MNEDPDQKQAARRAQEARESRERAEAHRRRRECDDDICRTFIPEQRRPVESPRR